MKINWFFEDIEAFDINDNFKKKIKQAIKDEAKKEGEINFIFCSDDNLLKMNIDYLNHDFYTDVITFDYSEGNIVSGDIFISKDRVEENSQDFNVSFQNELSRVMIHGVLHLLGYKDSSDEEKAQMRHKEDSYII